MRAHGQPFNDERLGNGAANFYRLAQPAGLDANRDAVAGALGPATMQQAAMRKWVRGGRRRWVGGAGDRAVASIAWRCEAVVVVGLVGFRLGLGWK